MSFLQECFLAQKYPESFHRTGASMRSDRCAGYNLAIKAGSFYGLYDSEKDENTPHSE
jgi:hypothetical protein